MATFTKLPSDLWRVQVRRKGNYASETFRLMEDAQAWGTKQEDRAFCGQDVAGSRPAKTGTLADLIELHRQDNAEASKQFAPATVQRK